MYSVDGIIEVKIELRDIKHVVSPLKCICGSQATENIHILMINNNSFLNQQLIKGNLEKQHNGVVKISPSYICYSDQFDMANAVEEEQKLSKRSVDPGWRVYWIVGKKFLLSWPEIHNSLLASTSDYGDAHPLIV